MPQRNFGMDFRFSENNGNIESALIRDELYIPVFLYIKHCVCHVRKKYCRCGIFKINDYHTGPIIRVQYYRVIALISVDIISSWDIEGRELASVRRYPNKG